MSLTACELLDLPISRPKVGTYLPVRNADIQQPQLQFGDVPLGSFSFSGVLVGDCELVYRVLVLQARVLEVVVWYLQKCSDMVILKAQL